MKAIQRLIAFILCFPSLVLAQLPAENFFSTPNLIFAALSPSGEHVATLRTEESGLVVKLSNTSTIKEHKLFSLAEHTEDEGTISDITWLDNQYLAVDITTYRKGVQNLLDTKRRSRLLIIDTQSLNTPNAILSVRTQGSLIHPMPTEAGKFMYSKSGIRSKIYTLDIAKLLPNNKKLGKLDRVDGGQFSNKNELISTDGFALKWFLNKQAKPEAVLYFSAERKLTLASIDDNNNFTPLEKFVHEEKKAKGKVETNIPYIPIATHKDEGVFYCLDKEEDTEKTIYEVNFTTGDAVKVYETSDYRVLDVVTNEERELIAVKVLRNGTIHYDHLNEEAQQASTTISSVFDVSENKATFLEYRDSHNTPPRIVLHKANKTISLGTHLPKLPNTLNSQQVSGSLLIAELDIPYLLNTPAKNSGPHGLIVMPHGGPYGVHDTPYFDSTTQYFVANGFAVLRINHRGSSGYSDALYEAGKQQWGDKILDDIHQTVIHISQRSDIDASKVCIAGMSYGGYAAAMLLTLYPEHYNCGVAIAGVYDLNHHLSDREHSEAQLDWIHEFIGDPSSEYEKLKAISPLYATATLQRPILVAHGDADEVVSSEQAYRYILALKKFNKAHEVFIRPELQHSMDGSQDSFDLMTQALEFVKAHISAN